MAGSSLSDKGQHTKSGEHVPCGRILKRNLMTGNPGIKFGNKRLSTGFPRFGVFLVASWIKDTRLLYPDPILLLNRILVVINFASGGFRNYFQIYSVFRVFYFRLYHSRVFRLFLKTEREQVSRTLANF